MRASVSESQPRLDLTLRPKPAKSSGWGLVWVGERAKMCEVSFPERGEQTMIYRTICFEI